MNDDGSQPKKTVARNIGTFTITVVAGIGLTIVAVPLLLVATCIPLAMGHPEAMIWVIPAYFGLATAGSAIIAVMTRNQGVRWGAIALFCLAVAVLLWLVVPLWR